MPGKRAKQPVGNNRLHCDTHATRSTAALTEDLERVLGVMRCYFVSYAKPGSVDWEVGIDRAVKAFGDERGPQVALRCLRAVQAMRVSRRSRFNFCDPFCACCRKRLTPNEGHLMRCLQAVSMGRTGEAKLAAVMLCEGNPDEAFLDAIHRLNVELDHCARERARTLPGV